MTSPGASHVATRGPTRAATKASPSAPARTYEARTVYGVLVRTFSHRDQAINYRDDMAAIGSEITIRVARVDRRLVA